MRGQVLIAVSALSLAAFAQPAQAQQYRTYQDGYANQSPACRQSHANRALGGAAIGGVAGAVAGNNIAGRGHRGDGSLLGAVVGAFLGGAIGSSTADQQPQCQGEFSGDPYYGQGRAPYDDDKYADNNRDDDYSRYDNGYRGDGYYGDDGADLDGGPDDYDGGK